MKLIIIENEEVDEQYNLLLGYWGSEDCNFTITEIAGFLQTTPEEVNNQIAVIKQKYPKTYKYYSKCRQKFRKQQKFESRLTPLSNDFLQNEFAWEKDTLYSHPVTSYEEKKKKHLTDEENSD